MMRRILIKRVTAGIFAGPPTLAVGESEADAAFVPVSPGSR
jgi:hypothetical protein